MFNTMTITKAAGAIIGAVLFLLLTLWMASGIFDMSIAADPETGEVPQAFTIELADSGASADEAEEEEEIDFDALLADADVAAGEKNFGKCRACHKLDGGNSTGPHLDGVVGRPIAAVDGFAYSNAMIEHADDYPDWSPEALYHFLANPRAEVPGTKMVFAGIRRPQEIADLVAYLEEHP